MEQGKHDVLKSLLRTGDVLLDLRIPRIFPPGKADLSSSAGSIRGLDWGRQFNAAFLQGFPEKADQYGSDSIYLEEEFGAWVTSPA